MQCINSASDVLVWPLKPFNIPAIFAQTVLKTHTQSKTILEIFWVKMSLWEEKTSKSVL